MFVLLAPSDGGFRAVSLQRTPPGLAVTPALDMADGAKKVVALASGGKA